MNIHEYQAKAVLKSFGAPVPDGVAVLAPQDARKAAEDLGGPVWVVKAQIHAGGRGKGRFVGADSGEGGGVRLTRSVDEVVDNAEAMLNRTLVTKQTGPDGRTVRRLLCRGWLRDSSVSSICPAWSTAKPAGSAFIASQEGGMDIEEVAATAPDKIITARVDPATGYTPISA